MPTIHSIRLLQTVVIVLDIDIISTVGLNVLYEFAGRSQVAKTVKIHAQITLFNVSNPMGALTLLTIQIDDAALIVIGFKVA